MAKRTKPAGPEAEEVDDAELVEREELPVDEVDGIARALAELGESGGGTVKVERVRDGKRLEYVDDFDAATFTLKELQQQFGGGEYRLTIKDTRSRYVKSGRVFVAQPRATASAEPSALDKIAEMMRAQAQQQEQLLKLVLLQQARPAQPAVSPDQLRSQLLQDLRAMHEITGGSGAGAGADKLIEVLKLGMEIARESEGGGDSLVNVASKALDILGDPIKQALESRTQPVHTPTAVTPPPGAAPAGGMSQAAPQPQPRKKAMDMKSAVAFLIEKAAAGADPGLYADLVLDNVPGFVLKNLLTGDAVEKLAAVDPRVKSHAEWFRDLQGMLSEAISSDAPGTGSESPAGNGDAGGNTAGP